MGLFCDPGNGDFREIRKSEYVDKSELIALVNRTLSTKYRLTCLSRPRRFGKSYAASMLAAYYDRSCDSAELFDDLKIAGREGYQEHRNEYHVMFLDIAVLQGEAENHHEKLVTWIENRLMTELREMYPELAREAKTVQDVLKKVVERDGDQFIAIIDEWDAPIRNGEATSKSQKDYLEFLRGFFKNVQITRKAFAGAYMTGILPIKKDGSQSAISEFVEYSILRPQDFARTIGFTEEEVREICERSGMDFGQMKAWYDGYRCGPVHSIYNANSVMLAVWNRKFDSYWRQTAAVTVLEQYINLDFDGLGQAVEDLLAGLEIPVETEDFQNDLTSFASADDVLTLLIHFGYLSYNEDTGTVRIPNYELREEFGGMIRKVTHQETIARVRECDQILEDTVAKRAEKVAERIQKIHQEESAILFYNSEQALRAVIKLAYFTYRDHYIRMEELPSGQGYADIVFLPKRFDPYPALVVELKYNDTAEGAIAQIKAREYPAVLKGYGAKILLVGISYDKEDVGKAHRCVIEEAFV